MNYVQTAIRASRAIPGVLGIVIAVGIGVGGYFYIKKRNSNSEINKEKDDGHEVHVSAAAELAAGLSADQTRGEEAPSGADSNQHEASHDAVQGDAARVSSADHALSDDRAFFQQIWDLVENEAKVSPTTKRAWYKSPDAMLRTRFRDSQPSTFETSLVRFMIFPVSTDVNVVFAEDRENPVPSVMFLNKGNISVVPMLIGEIDKHRGTHEISGQALYYVYEKCKELEQVRLGKIHPHLAYPEGFKIDGLNLKNFELKGRSSQQLEQRFFDLVFEGSGRELPTISKMWSRSNACFVTSAVNRGAQPIAVRYQNLEGEKFLHVTDPQNPEHNLVLLRRPNGIVQIFRPRSASDSINLSVVKGYEHWRVFTNELFDFRRQEHVELANHINQDIAAMLFANAA